MQSNQFFHYKVQKTFLHKIPAWIKIISILILAIISFYLPVRMCLILYPVLILFSLIFLKFTVSEIFSDSKPIIAYIFLLYFAGIILNTINSLSSTEFSEIQLVEKLQTIFKPNFTYLPLLTHLALSLEITSIFYRTTSHGQLKDGFSTIEYFLTRKKTSPLSDTLSLALSFIPKISFFWFQLNFAWSGRGGTKSIKKALFLFPKLFHIAMREGNEKSLAIQNRSL